MTLQPAVFANALVLSVAGRLDQMTCETFFARRLARTWPTRLLLGRAVLDLAKLDYVSSAGLRCFMIAAKEAKAKSARSWWPTCSPWSRRFSRSAASTWCCRSLITSLTRCRQFQTNPRLPIWRARDHAGTLLGDAVPYQWRSRRRIFGKNRDGLAEGRWPSLRGRRSGQRLRARRAWFSVAGTHGGHTPCVEIETGTGDYLVCDMGSGARPFGAHVNARQHGKPATIHILMSHVHWDHIMGFPFFRPAYVPGNTVRIYGCHEVLEQAFRMQQDRRAFPFP